MAMFPPALPHFLIRWLTDMKDVVYDPFSGRGTVLLEAGLLGRIPVGSDANPLAWILSSAKARPVSLEVAIRRLDSLAKIRPSRGLSSTPQHVRQLFNPIVLSQLETIRKSLSKKTPVDRFLLATLCGVLHLNARKDGTPRGLTVAMPNTFAMSPNYVARYIKEKRLRAPKVDVLAFLRRRVEELLTPRLPPISGCAWTCDARDVSYWPAEMPKASLILTSPPYLRVMLYGKMNWLRSWLIDADPKAIDHQLFTSSSLPRYIDFMTEVLAALRRKLRPDGRICLVVGDVQRGFDNTNLAREVIMHCLSRTDLKLQAVLEDNLPVQHKVSRIWGDTRGRATKTDRVIVLGGPKARGIPHMPAIDWVHTTSVGEITT
jgi:site-specific DNA-methyltransferase (adenine-specific)